MNTYLEELKKRDRESFDKVQRVNDLFKNKGSGETYTQPPSSVPTLTGAVSNKSGKLYEPSINYTQQMHNAEKNGNWAAAAENERLHNAKEGDLGLGWGISDKWNYLDKNGYGGQMQAMRNEIENYKPFSYDYRTDDMYLSMKRLKEKEAEKAYADGYAQLSSAFDGDIPVNMINKLLTTKNDIIDSADSYIPQLRQMAYDMYNVERNDLYNQYSLLSNAAQQDYAKWSDDRYMNMQGLQNDIANRQWQQSFDTENEQWQKSFDNENAWKDKEWDYAVSQNAQARQDAITDTAVSLWKTGKFSSIDAAYDEALRLYNRTAATSPSSYDSGGSASGRKISAPTSQQGGSDNKDNPKVVETGKLVVDKNGKIKIIA